jgi:hypothetical protein
VLAGNFFNVLSASCGQSGGEGRARADDGRREEYDKVGEDDDGHLVVEHRARGGPLDNTQEEDGHYSDREESFKKVRTAH